MAGRRILVIKHGALGDVIQGLDAYASLREGHAHDHLAVLTSPAFAGLFHAMPFFDEVLVDKRAGPLNIPETLRIRRLLKDRWDRIYDFQSSRRTARYFAHFVPTGVETVTKFKGATHPHPDMSHLNNRDRMLETAKLGGCPEVIASTDWLLANDQKTVEHYAVLIPGCSPVKPEKRWSADHYADLAQQIIQTGMQPILVGTSIDKAVGQVIMDKVPACRNMIGKTSLTELASLLARASVAVGNDTGPVFMAARLGAPTLMLMSQHTDPAMSAPYGASASWLREDDINTITVDDVFDQLRKMNPAL